MGALAVLVRVPLLWDDPWAPGYDGWYYVLQVRALMGGEWLFADTSLVHPFLVAVALLVGDVVVGNKVACCLFAAVTAAGGAVAAWRWTHARWAGLATGVWWATSSLHVGISAEYLKNEGGLAVLACTLALLPGAERHRGVMAAVLGLAVLGPFVHKLTGTMGIAVVLGYVIVRAVQDRLSARVWLTGGVVALLVVVAIGALGLLRPTDLARLVGDAPGLPRLGALLGPRLPLAEQIEALVVHGVPLVLLAGLVGAGGRRFRAFGLPLVALAVVCVAPGLPFDFNLTSWRLLLMGFVGTGLSLALLTARVGWPVVPVAVVLGLSHVAWTVPSQAEREPDYAAWAPFVPVIQAHVSPTERVVAHRGVCGFVWAEADRICENFQPAGDLSGWWRISWGMGEARLAPYSDRAPVPLASGYTLVREPSWQAFRNDHVHRFSLLNDPRNPSRPRPGFVYGPGRHTPEPE